MAPLLSPIGKVLFLDLETYNKTRGSVDKFKLQIDLTNPRPQHILLVYDDNNHGKGKWQAILYDESPEYYFYCKYQGRAARSCAIKGKDEEERQKLFKDNQGDGPKKETSTFQGMQNTFGIVQQQTTNKSKAPINEWQNQKRKSRDNQRLIFKPRCPNKYKGGQIDTSALSILNDFTALQRESENTCAYPGNTERDPKLSPRGRLVSYLHAKKMISRGYIYHLVHVKDSISESPSLEMVLVVNEYSGVFPKDVPGISLEREIDFGIDLLPNTQPISIPPYRMAPAKLRELKEQLKDLLDKGFIRPSIFP
ncbi:hypothetical protein FXO38_09061 [Capsicum annuum]|nr:hypothetical protein FXO38_09061 [Capsicum annuum]KAF3668945.1 hypothetical protein FXO37_09276 [Capsicum annuum]